MKPHSFLPLAALALLGLAGPAAGQGSGTTLYALTSGNQIVTVNSANPDTALSTVSVTNLAAGESLFSIDFRPGNGLLYGVATNTGTGSSTLYTINPATGSATVVGSAGGIVLSEGANPVIDFNPTNSPNDRLRLLNGNGNLRVNPGTGTISNTDTTLFYAAGGKDSPNIRGIAYTNSFAGAPTTTLYRGDVNRGDLVTIGGPNTSPSPNLGQVFSVGSLGLVFQDPTNLGFEILGTGEAFLAAAAFLPTQDGPSLVQPEGTLFRSLFSINLTTGAATRIGGFATNTGFSFISLTAAPVPVPEPSTVALVAAAGALGVARAVRRRRKET